MVTSRVDSRQKTGDLEQPVAAASAFLASLPAHDEIRQCCEEGRAIAEIVEGLGLAPSVIAAVHVYPLL
ncbi:MAG: hypothetical protein ACE5KS_05605, partial [Woeseiaceae bacterium]